MCFLWRVLGSDGIAHNRLHPLKSAEGAFQLDACALEGDSYGFCERCFLALHRGHIPKFSALNGVNVTMCHLYPAELEDLTLTEECAIARSHPIGTILKLKPNGFRSPAAYNAINGHFINIPQNPGPLLDILPSPTLRFHEHIKIVWTGKTEPTKDDLKGFVQIRKDKVIRALLWLCEHNPLYGSVQVNHQLLAQWSDTFIPSVLQETLIMVPEDKDSEERGTYAGDMDGNFENDLHSALHDMAKDTIASGAVYSDVEGHRQNPELKMVMALKEMLDRPGETLIDVNTAKAAEVPLISWVGEGPRVLMNDYEDAEFFTGAFPTLFPYGKGGHLLHTNERRVPISLETWAKWLLSHHSRRFVWKSCVVSSKPTDLNSGLLSIRLSYTCCTTLFNGGILRLAIPSLSNEGITKGSKMLYLLLPVTSCLPPLAPYVQLERPRILLFKHFVGQYRQWHLGSQILSLRRKRCVCIFELILSNSVGVLGGSQRIRLT